MMAESQARRDGRLRQTESHAGKNNMLGLEVCLLSTADIKSLAVMV